MAMQRFMLPPAFCPIFGSFEKNLTKNAQKFWRFKKLSYLCIAFSENGRLAQLVQSVCLTSRGSGVRIPQCPLTNHYHCKTIQAVFLTKTAFFIIIFLPILIFVDNFDTN